MNCHPTHCGMEVELAGEHVHAVRGDPQHPESKGFLCIRGQAAAEIVDSPARVLTPRARAADGSWSEVDWERALETIVSAIQDVGLTRTALFTGHGVRNQFSARFAHMLGAQWWDPSIVCWGLGGFGFRLTGVTEVNTAEDMAAHADLILLWGANLISQPTTSPKVQAARRRGARVIAIDVRVSESFSLADETFVLRPGTDTELALALMHVIVTEKLYDEPFVREHTLGFDELAAHVAKYDPHWAAAQTGIEAARIVQLARAFASTKQAMLLVGGSSMHKTGNSWHAARAIACLPALTGSLGHAGAGMGPRHAGQSHGMGLGRIVPPDVKPPESVVPAEMSAILEALESGKVEVLLLFGTNFVSSFADAGRVGRALERLKLVVSFDLFEHDTSREHAHLFLPGTSWLEEVGYKLTNTHLYLTDQVLRPRGEARPSFWVLQQLARRLGRDDYFPWSSIEHAIDSIFDHDALAHVSVARLREAGGAQRLAVGAIGHEDLRFSTPSGKIELVSERAREHGLSSLPEPPSPGENHARSPLATRYPLLFVQGRSIAHFHSFYDHGRALPTLRLADPEPVLWLNRLDAEARGVEAGGYVRIHNERGEMDAKALVTDKVPPGVVWMHDGWRGINQLTSSARLVSNAIAQSFPAGAAAYEARVEVESSSG